MKKEFLPFLGLTPFLFGWVMNHLILLSFPAPLWIFGLIMLYVWSRFASLLKNDNGSTVKTILLLNAPALIVLFLLFIQEIVLKAYWGGFIGSWTQLFYLPCLSLGYMLTGWATRTFPAYCAVFILMIAASVWGCFAKKKQY